MELSFIKEQLRNRLPELLILVLMALLVWINLSVFLQVDVWRQDSMYYVGGYDDKLAEEGRWINYLFFNFLRILPSDIAILVSYGCVLGFAYSVAHRVTSNSYFSLAFGILCVLVPVLPVQLEWPETILFAFIFLALSPRLQQVLPNHYFFPLMGIVFFGTFSAFYFLMPLLFLRDLNFTRFWQLMAYWLGGFILAYAVTQLLVLAFTGHTMQIAGWRQPHYVVDVASLLDNLARVTSALMAHWGKAQHFLKPAVLAVLVLIAIGVAIAKKQYFIFIVALISALGIYVSVIPIGIYIQERTTLCAFIALFAALFLYGYQSRKALLAVMVVMCLLAIRLAATSYEGISWYKSQNDILLEQFAAAIQHSPAEVTRVFIAAEGAESRALFSAIEVRTKSKNIFSEGFSHPLYWVPALKEMGYVHFRVCLDLQGWDCDQIKEYYQRREEFKQEQGLFISHYLPSGDLLIMINPQANLTY